MYAGIKNALYVIKKWKYGSLKFTKKSTIYIIKYLNLNLNLDLDYN